METLSLTFSFNDIELQSVLNACLLLSLTFNILYFYNILRRQRHASGKATSPKFMPLSDEEETRIMEDLFAGRTSHRQLEMLLGDANKAVAFRREYVKFLTQNNDVEGIPMTGFDFTLTMGSNCENPIGYVPVPLGLAGPLTINAQQYYAPMATTEGALIASVCRGCKALNLAQRGVTTRLLDDGMTRAPVVAFPSLQDAADFTQWIDANFKVIKRAFDAVSKHLNLTSIKCKVVGKLVYVRFKAQTGNAMGMNMISKGCLAVIDGVFRKHHPQMELIALSGNYCSDKKAAAINWIEGRGKSVVAEAKIPSDVIKKVLGTTSNAMVRLNTTKNLIGSMVAGGSGGAGNAHAANIVAAIFIALGQDAAQVSSSSSCLTAMEVDASDDSLYVSCTMPSIEVGTVGGGTRLPAQHACLSLIKNHGRDIIDAGMLAQVICAYVMAGEISLLASLSENTLMTAHNQLNQHRTQKS